MLSIDLEIRSSTNPVNNPFYDIGLIGNDDGVIGETAHIVGFIQKIVIIENL